MSRENGVMQKHYRQQRSENNAAEHDKRRKISQKERGKKTAEGMQRRKHG
jgi:hypothetical protein